MKIKAGFILRKVAEQHILIPVGTMIKDYSGLIQLNDTGCFLWSKLKEDTGEQDLIKALTEEYPDLTPEDAGADIREFLETLRERGLLEDER